MKRALITGITGQTGSYMAEFLLTKGYKVYGMVRRLSNPNHDRIEHIKSKINLIYGDLIDQSSLLTVLKESNPDEVYNYAAQSFVPVSFTHPILCGEMTGLGVTRLLESIKLYNNKIKYLQASTSEMIGNASECPQNENSKFHPVSPYGISKLYAYWTTVNYREAYNMFCANAIMFNNESPRRGLEFVTRKITKRVAEIKFGLAKELILGNLDAKRDWGFSGDFVKANWLILQQDKPDDFILATGESHSVREFCELAFARVSLNWKNYVKTSTEFYRPAEINQLRGNAEKARKLLGWVPTIKFEDLVNMMVDSDLKLLQSKGLKTLIP